MRILIVEDEPKMASYLRKGLMEASFQVDNAPDGREGLFLALEEDYNLIVLDVMLPKLNGLDLLRQLRGRKQTPVLLLTARDTVEDTVAGLESGADDYLTKPFAYAELLARIRALLRRPAHSADTVLFVGDMEIDLLRRRVRRGSARIELTAQGIRAGEALCRAAGRSADAYVRHVAGVGHEFRQRHDVVDVAIKRLRSKIDNPFETRLLHTVRGMGYVMEPRP